MMSENLFYKMLKEALQTKELICIFRDPTDLRRFAVGYIVAVSEIDYTLQQVDPEGNQDGLDIGAIENIIEIRKESRYVRQISILMENKDTMLQPYSGWTGIPNPESCLESVLEQSIKDTLVVNMQLTTGDDEIRFYGLVREISESHVKLDVLTDDGEPDGTTVIKIGDISGLQINTREERKVALFHKHRTHLYL